jgi:cytochrome c-type biogenesis protein CcmE
VKEDLPSSRDVRLGGLVEEGSVQRADDGVTVEFRVTDRAASVPVVYAGVLPDLFREGQGVITEGHLRPDGVFEAREVLAKHDETYMPPEVAEALKKAGEWRPEATQEAGQ